MNHFLPIQIFHDEYYLLQARERLNFLWNDLVLFDATFDYISHLKMRIFFCDLNLHKPFSIDDLQTSKMLYLLFLREAVLQTSKKVIFVVS
jgi:hypothetical protein